MIHTTHAVFRRRRQTLAQRTACSIIASQLANLST